MNLSGIMDKKIGPVPVVYIAAGFVAILGVVAWRMKSTPDSAGDPTEESATGDTENPYDQFESGGTVIVQPSTPTQQEVDDNRPDTNEEWIREGAEWLIATKKVSGTAAYTALSKYVEGKSRSIQENQWVELVIAEKGFPPDAFQETPLPPPSTSPVIPPLEPPTVPIRPKPTTPVPMPTPKPVAPSPAPGSKPGYGWYQVKRGDSPAFIAGKYGITVNTFYAYNGKDSLRIGEYVKVRATSNPTWGYRG